jgi:hypothetical protein
MPSSAPKTEPSPTNQRKVRFSNNVEAASPPPWYQKTAASTDTSIAEEPSADQPIVVAIRQKYRNPAKIQQGLQPKVGNKENESTNQAVVQPSMNSSRVLERKIRALEAQQFEREAVLKQLEPEIHKKVAQHASKVNVCRFTNSFFRR